MVAKISPIDEAILRENSNALLRTDSELIEAIGYWIGTSTECKGYLIVRPFGLPSIFGVEAIRGWVEPALRGIGVFSKLRTAAAANGVLGSDREGMTEDAFRSWIGSRGFSHCYFDQQCMWWVAISRTRNREIYRLACWPKVAVGA